MSTKPSPDTQTFTVGKLDAGMAILLGERAHLIEFPSILLPPGATTGSIVNIAVHQNRAEEKRRDAEFWELQDDILKEYGVNSPKAPELKVRNVTQTSVTLEWPVVDLASAKLRSLDIYRNNQRLAAIPSPTTNTSTKVSGLEINAEYTFQLVLRTTAGTFPSPLLHVRTHTMTDTSGICVCFGNVQDEVLLENAKMALGEMGAKWSDKIQIDTTHFVCTTPAATPAGAQATGSAGGAPGVEYQRALQLSIPVVQPLWILACHAEQRMMPIAPYYLGATPNTPASASYSSNRPQSMSHTQIPYTPPATGGSSKGTPASYRSSMPPPARSPPNSAGSFVNNQPFSAAANTAASSRPQFEPTVEESATDDADAEEVKLEASAGSPDEQTPTSASEKRKSRAGTMNKKFKFPPSPPAEEAPPLPSTGEQGGQVKEEGAPTTDKGKGKAKDSEPPVMDVPPPPPVEKERTRAQSMSESEDDVGDTVDIPL
ncbi:fibronectin type III/BRCA1 domain-containing protein [Coprinopsis sp. MPI-PUGE-AT-0042]|nr:fibronectin type III/BRCA1 domain-containing protein [Coprinopsis sp. MPI-PUGE-AT-0042]